VVLNIFVAANPSHRTQNRFGALRFVSFLDYC